MPEAVPGWIATPSRPRKRAAVNSAPYTVLAAGLIGLAERLTARAMGGRV